MIRTRTPLRISLGGGGTDLPGYYQQFEGFVLAASIKKYITIDVQKTENGKVIYQGLEKEEVDHVSELSHDITRAALQEMQITEGIKIVSNSDVPPGTGLGSSGAYGVGLLSGLHALMGQSLERSQLAEMACKLEMNILQKPVGKQDQYMAAYGGFTTLDINNDGEVEIQALKIEKDVVQQFNKNLLLFYTGTQRDADEILKDQNCAVQEEGSRVAETMHRIKEIGLQVKEALEKGNIRDVGALFDKHWMLKRTISSKMTNPRFDAIYQLAKKQGALGGKIGGAGGGGFFIFYVEKNHNAFIKDMEDLQLSNMDYSFVFDGTKTSSL